MSDSTQGASRRQFLKTAAAGAAGVGLAAGLPVPGEGTVAEPHDDPERNQGTPDEYDIAIVGGGVAGCYVAYRLLHGDIDPGGVLGQYLNGRAPKVGLFEYSGRVGGRLLSAEIPQQMNPDAGVGSNDPSSARKYAEFGGFRFQDQMHIVRDLATLLDLSHEPFPFDEPKENFVYVRGTRLTRGTVTDTSKLPYAFSPAEALLLMGGFDLTSYVANLAFSSILDNYHPENPPPLADLLLPAPTDKDIPLPPAFPSDTYPNGYSYLRYKFQKAFHIAQSYQGDMIAPVPAAVPYWEFARQSRKFYEQVKQEVVIDGRPLTDWSWWALMSRFLSNEAIAYLEDTGGYNALWSAGNVSSNLREDFYFANELDDFGSAGSDDPCEQTVWKHITTGYSDIPNQLYSRFLQSGGTGRLNHQLVSFAKAGDRYDLRFFQRESGTLSSGEAELQIDQDPKSLVTVNAKFVVLAMPKRALELLDRQTFFLQDPTVNQLVDTVLSNPAIRLFMAYKEPWWRNQGVTCGRSTTDLPVRQFYYWHTASETNTNQESFLLATYSNAEAEHFWRSLQKGAPFDDFKGSVRHAPPGSPGHRHDAPQGRGPRAGAMEMAKLAHDKIMQVVGVENAPEPYYAHFQNWTKDPWGAGWHAFTAGHSDNELIPQILQPLPQETIYICGECWSNVQGWVQGALNTSEVMLQNKLGLTWPSWLSTGGTWLGPGSPEPTL